MKVIPVNDLRNFHLDVRVELTRQLRARLWLGMLLIRAAARVLRCGVAIKHAGSDNHA
jgi:hypothetical protein